MRFIKILIGILVVAFDLSAQPTISFTFDDGITDDMPGYAFEKWSGMLLDHLDEAGVKSMFFVTGSNKINRKGQDLLKSWNDRGHQIANHTYTHPNYGSKDVTFEKFKIEFLRTDSIINKFSHYSRFFRFPYLKEGNTKEKVEAFRALLDQYQYRNGYVTIDASDWYINSRLRSRLQKDPGANIEVFRQFYLEHLMNRALYYEDLAFKLTGRHISHTLLLHHNLTSALFIGDLARLFKEKGWKVISAADAYKDPIFMSRPANIPAGESLIWALAKERGGYEAMLRYPAEDGMYEKDRMDKLGL
ncbi:MAG: polysaccharide deacetylase family protein [Chryseolinea sp.]